MWVHLNLKWICLTVSGSCVCTYVAGLNATLFANCHSFYLLFAVTVLTVDGEGASSVKVTLNPYCHDNRNFTVYFGVRQQGCGECVPQQSKTADIAPGQSVILTPILMLDQGQEYCSPNATLTPGPGRFGVLLA